MRRNSRRPKPLHAAMKAVTGSGSPGLGRLVAVAALFAAAGAALWGIYAGLTKLYGFWVDQCVVSDVRTQIRIRATPHVSEELVREMFKLTNGCNLAKMDFGAMREEVLKKHPIIADISVTRRLPDGLDISLSERKPIVRIVSGEDRKKARGYLPWNVADETGVVFGFKKKDTGNLPMIIVPGPLPARGERLSGRALSALRLISLCEQAGIPGQEFAEVSTENRTYMKITTRTYRSINLSWRILDPPDDPKQPKLLQVMSNYKEMVATRLTPDRISFWITDLTSIQMEEPKL